MGRTSTLRNLKSEIDNNFVVRIWDLNNPNEDNSPFVLQDFDPISLEPFSSKDAAQSWLDKTIVELNQPPISPEEINRTL